LSYKNSTKLHVLSYIVVELSYIVVELYSATPPRTLAGSIPRVFFFFCLKSQLLLGSQCNDQNLYLNSVLPNDPLVVERFFETMEIWHV
jgi:hypothetical protein